MSVKEFYAALDHASPYLPKNDRTAMLEIAKRESELRPEVMNSRGSSAYGLFQMLKQTRKTHKLANPRCPSCQCSTALRYIRGRYKTPSRALDFWKANGVY